MARQPRAKQRRPGKFTASDYSTPTFDGEKPATLDNWIASNTKLNAGVGFGEDLLCRIDEILESAFTVLSNGPNNITAEGLGAVEPPDANTATAFAMRIAAAAGPLKWAIMNAAVEPPEPIRLAHDVMTLSALHFAMHFEFVEGNAIVAFREQAEHQRQGGLDLGKSRRRTASRRMARWQTDADAIWKENPGSSPSEVGGVISKKYPGKSEFHASASTIRQKIKKPVGEQTTPSAPGDN